MVPCEDRDVARSTPIRTRTKLGSFFHSSISSTWPAGTPAKVDLGAVGEPVDRLLEEDVVFLLRALAELGEPDDERRQQREQQQA